MAYGHSIRAFIENGPVEQVEKVNAGRSTARVVARAQRSSSARADRARSMPANDLSTTSRWLSEPHSRDERILAMIDETYDRNYHAARNELNAAIARGFGRLGHAMANAFQVLNRIEYESPWASTSERPLH